jgi:Arc/MetJ-type ribon-helix-helix transcriptional regulator
MAKKAPFGVHLSKTMEAFLDQLVKEGRAINPREAIRGLIWQEIKRWERANRRTFETVGKEAANEEQPSSVKKVG